MKEHKINLLKALQNSGLGSRRRLANLIIQGDVSVNNMKIENLNHLIDIDRDIVSISNRIVNIRSRQTLVIMLNKPYGVISSTRDERDRKTVIDLLPDKYRSENLYPAGRLDKNSTGLLLLTNNGELAYRITHPRFEHEKEYYVRISSRLSTKVKKKLEKGIELEDGTTYPAVIREIPGELSYTYSIVIHEGRKRQVRRMFESQGYTVISLHRVRIGSLYLGDLKINGIRVLSETEIKKLLSH
jgi:23S rRNA pseudouridine2605 synthase